MARLFDDAQSEYLQIDQAVLAGTPLAMVCWFRTNDMEVSQELIGLYDKDSDDHMHRLYLSNDVDKLAVGSKDGVYNSTKATAVYVVNTWHHACGIWVSATDRRVLMDGGSKNTSAVEISPVGLDRTSIGRAGVATPIAYMSGMIAEAAIYDLSDWPGATDSDKADNFEKILPSLAKTYTPEHYPLGLVAYWPLVRDD